MKKEFVPYELALRMKQLGFDKDCFGWYSKNGDFYEGKMTIHQGLLLAPLYQQAFSWLREEHGLHGEPIWDNNYKTYWFFSITKIGDVDFVKGRHNYEAPLKEDQDFKEGFPVVLKWTETFDEAQKNCLEKLIEIVEENLIN